MPGLDKHVEDAAAHALAFHRNLFGQIDLHHCGTPCIDDVERAAPHLGFATTSSHGTADLAPAMHEHLCPHLARNGALALDDGGHGSGFTARQSVYEFLKKFS